MNKPVLPGAGPPTEQYFTPNQYCHVEKVAALRRAENRDEQEHVISSVLDECWLLDRNMRISAGGQFGIPTSGLGGDSTGGGRSALCGHNAILAHYNGQQPLSVVIILRESASPRF